MNKKTYDLLMDTNWSYESRAKVCTYNGIDILKCNFEIDGYSKGELAFCNMRRGHVYCYNFLKTIKEGEKRDILMMPYEYTGVLRIYDRSPLTPTKILVAELQKEIKCSKFIKI